MIYITGDTHGLIDFKKLKKYFRHRYASKKDVLIILGDAGIVWSETDCSIFQYQLLGPTVLFIDGNHENFALLNQFPIVERFGAKVHYLDRDVYHVLRGEILQINGASFLCLGGATSIDKAQRIPGLSWWEEEHIIDEDVETALNHVKWIGGKVDYVLTHCAPSAIVASMFGYPKDADTEQLSKLQGSIAYDHWYFGHYHEDCSKGRFRCFYYDILELPILNTGKHTVRQHILTYDENLSPYLWNWNTGRRTSHKPQDLPEWFLEEYSYRYWYYDLSGVKDVAYEGSFFDNHINKDSTIYLAYDGKHPKNKDQSPKDKKEWEVHTWRASLVQVIHGLEKYSPGLKLNPIKAQINLTYDQFNNGSMYYFGSNGVSTRPFPYVKTPRYQDRWKDGIAQYEVYHGTRILGTFIHKERAIEYAEHYITDNLHYPLLQYLENEEEPYFRSYDTGHDPTRWVSIKAIEE